MVSSGTEGAIRPQSLQTSAKVFIYVTYKVNNVYFIKVIKVKTSRKLLVLLYHLSLSKTTYSVVVPVLSPMACVVFPAV